MRRHLLALVVAALAAACAPGSSTKGASTASTASVEPVEAAVSIHVEGRVPYERHRTIIDALADEAADAGVVLSFELSRRFTEASLAADDGFVASLAARGHAVGVHADLGFPPIPPPVFTRRLAEHKALVEEALGAPVSHVSGVCSPAPWVEPVIDAGFTVVTGTVTYCLMSTPDAPDCASPSDCHDPLPAEPTPPWRTSSSADWLTPDPGGELWVVPVERVVSVGTPPADGFVDELATLDVRWTSVAALAR